MAQVAKRRRHEAPARTGSNIMSMLVIVLGVLGLGYYLLPAIMSGDPLWFSTSFDARPRQITVIDRGQRTTIAPSDPRFAPLVDAFNQTITQGHRPSSLGFSQATWDVVDRNGLLVEAVYAAPVKIHSRGGFEPTQRLVLLISGKDIHTTKVLFRSNPDAIDPIPLLVNTVEPLQRVLAQQGFGT